VSVQDDTLNACIDEMERGIRTRAEGLRRHPAVAEALAPILGTIERCHRAPKVVPSTAFRAAARVRMLNLMATAPAGTPQRREVGTFGWLTLPRPMGALLRAGLALVLLFAAAASTASAASAALPGSPFYLLKLGLEDTRLILATSDVERADLQVAMAGSRAREIAAVADSASPEGLDWVIGLYEEAVRGAVQHAVGASEAQAVEARLTSQQQQLQETLGALPLTELERRASLGRALGFLERERTELRSRLGQEPLPDPTDTPTRDDQQREQQVPGMPLTPSPTATLEPTVPPPPVAGQQSMPISGRTQPIETAEERNRWGRADDTPTVGPAGTPAAAEQVGQHGPAGQTPIATAAPEKLVPPESPAAPQQGQLQQQGAPADATPSPSPPAEGDTGPVGWAGGCTAQTETPTTTPAPSTATPPPSTLPSGGFQSRSVESGQGQVGPGGSGGSTSGSSFGGSGPSANGAGPGGR